MSAGMDALVLPKSRRLREAFSTSIASELLLVGMQKPVNFQVPSAKQVFPADVTTKASLGRRTRNFVTNAHIVSVLVLDHSSSARGVDVQADIARIPARASVHVEAALLHPNGESVREAVEDFQLAALTRAPLRHDSAEDVGAERGL